MADVVVNFLHTKLCELSQLQWSHVVIWIAAFPARPSVLLVTKSVAIAQTVDQPSVDVREMGPYFMMAALVSRFDAKNLMIKFECAVTAYGPFICRSWWLNKSTPLAVNAAWLPQCCRALWSWCVRICKRLLNRAVMPLVLTAFPSPCSTVEVASYHVKLFLIHSSTNCKYHVFLGVVVVEVERHHGEAGFTIASSQARPGRRYLC